MSDGEADAFVVGSGPNGLAAAIVLARAGRRVTVFEGADQLGGGCRSEELTLPGYVHDTCSTVHALARASPFLASLPLAEHGLELVHPEAPLAHPLDDGTAVMLERSVELTARGLGPDARAYRRLLGPLVRQGPQLMSELLGPLRPPRHPLLLARFAPSAPALGDGTRAVTIRGRAGARAAGGLQRTLDAVAAHGVERSLRTRADGQRPPGRLARRARRLAALGRRAGHRAAGLRRQHRDRPSRGVAGGARRDAGTILLDVTPRQLVALAGERLPARYARRLGRYRYGPGVFKLDWALDGPIPWTAAETSRAGTVHLGGTLGEIAAAEEDVAGPPPGSAVRPARAADALRPVARAGGQAHSLGLLPRPERLDA